MTLHELNTLPPEQLKQELFKCCNSEVWVTKMLPFFPADDMVELLNDAEDQWYECSERDWLDTFSYQHGNDKAKKISTPVDEQEVNVDLSTEAIDKFKKLSSQYEDKFGFTFIVADTPASPVAMLGAIERRLFNSRAEEIKIAMDEQNKITQMRLQKLLS